MKPLCPDILKYIYNYLPLENLLDISTINIEHRYTETFLEYYLLRFKKWKISSLPFYSFTKTHHYYNQKVKFLIGIFLNTFSNGNVRIKFLNIYKKLKTLTKKEQCTRHDYCGGYAYTMRIRETLKPICYLCDNR